MNVNEYTDIQAKNRLIISVKAINKDSAYALRRSYSPLFYKLMRALDAMTYKKETVRNPALLGGVSKDLLKSVDAQKFGVKFEPSDIRYDHGLNSRALYERKAPAGRTTISCWWISQTLSIVIFRSSNVDGSFLFLSGKAAERFYNLILMRSYLCVVWQDVLA